MKRALLAIAAMLLLAGCTSASRVERVNHICHDHDGVRSIYSTVVICGDGTAHSTREGY